MCSMDKNRGAETKQLDDGIGDTLVLALSGSLEWPCSCLLRRAFHLGENHRQIFRDRPIATGINLQPRCAGKIFIPKIGEASPSSRQDAEEVEATTNHRKKRNQQKGDSFYFGCSLCGLPLALTFVMFYLAFAAACSIKAATSLG